MLNVELNTLANGELQEKFNREVTKVIDNMQDPNTPFGDTRSITIKINFKQNEKREDAKIDISVTSKLAGVIKTTTGFFMGKDLRTGQLIVKEYGKQIPGQMSLTDMESDTEEKKVVSMPRQLKA